jgi:hypothetical protein
MPVEEDPARLVALQPRLSRSQLLPYFRLTHVLLLSKTTESRISLLATSRLVRVISIELQGFCAIFLLALLQDGYPKGIPLVLRAISRYFATHCRQPDS